MEYLKKETLISIAKRIYVSKTVLENRIKNGYYTLNINKSDIIIENKGSRKYKYLEPQIANLIIEIELNKAIEIKKEFEKYGWNFDYDITNANSEKEYKITDEIPQSETILFTPYLYPYHNPSPINLINESQNSYIDMMLYINYMIKKHKITPQTKFNTYGNLIERR